MPHRIRSRQTINVSPEFRSQAEIYRGLVHQLDALEDEERSLLTGGKTAALLTDSVRLSRVGHEHGEVKLQADVAARALAAHVVTRLFGPTWRMP